MNLKTEPGSQWDEAGQFLRWLDPEATAWAFRTLPDSGTGRGHNLTGSLAQLAPTLVAENASGRGVFAVVNAGGQRGAEINRIRAVFVDLDGAPLEPITAGPLLPHLIVESSPGRWHCYWLCDGLAPDQFGPVQRTIAARFGGDPTVCDLPRVMRLPGFLHRKREPFRSRVATWNGSPRYSAAQVLAAFPPTAAVAPAALTVSVEGVTVEGEGTRHADLVALCARLARAGLSLDTARATVEAEADRGRWSRDVTGEIEGALQSAFAKVESGEIARPVDSWAVGFGKAPLPEGARPIEAQAPALRSVPVGDVLTAHVSPPRFVVDPLIPAGHVTLFGSHGGAGKSLLALTLAAHVAAGVPWAGRPVMGCPVLFVSLEDAGAIVRFRLRKVIEAYGLDVAAVAARLRIADGSAGSAALVSESVAYGVRVLAPTATLAELQAMVADAGLVIVDNASDAFDGQENDRRQVRTFVRALAALGPAVLLLAHIDKAAARFGAAGQSFSGSTAWHNSARSRLALVSDRAGPSLVQEKLNLGRAADPIRLEWSPAGVLVPAAANGAAAGSQTETDAAAVLVALEAAARDGVNVPTARSGPATAQRVLESLPDLPAHLRGARGREDFWAAIATLQRSERIATEEFLNDSRHRRERFAVRHCAGSALVPQLAQTSEPALRTRASAPVPAQGVRGIDARTEPARKTSAGVPEGATT